MKKMKRFTVSIDENTGNLFAARCALLGISPNTVMKDCITQYISEDIELLEEMKLKIVDPNYQAQDITDDYID
jgi:hypothetical protein